MAMRHPLPDSCIRGPELHDPQDIQHQIAQQDWAALESYGVGIDLVQRVWKLMEVRERMHERLKARAFLLHQLRSMEQQTSQAVSAALALFDQQRSDQVIDSASAAQPAEESAEKG